MAQRQVIEWIDDVDGSEAAEAVTFHLDGADYEIDLSDKNASKMRDVLAPFVQAGRRTGGRQRVRRVG